MASVGRFVSGGECGEGGEVGGTSFCDLGQGVANPRIAIQKWDAYRIYIYILFFKPLENRKVSCLETQTYILVTCKRIKQKTGK